MAEPVKIVTGIGNAELHRILVRGYDLNKELVGKNHLHGYDLAHLARPAADAQ